MPAATTTAPTFDEQAALLRSVGVGADLEALRPYADNAAATDPTHLPFVLVAGGLDLDAAMAHVIAKGKPGRVDMTPLRPHDFAPIEGTEPPASPYLLLDVDLGARFRNATPEAALIALRAEGRTPLTIDEGVSMLLQVPDALHARTAYSLLASRRADQRVPALWMSYGAPRLGWCWDRNPHTWLGSASAAARITV
ncbi:DUF5701 family protein [Longivirga aurantiaca]|uniref:DUF5701 family protein n=1 Tax=Longivirga aurantiaca TaxID=1837743 RepID=A0ABW1SY19_9ACTN